MLIQLSNEKYQEETEIKSRTNIQARDFTFIVYKENTPDDWIESLEEDGYTFAVSPLHNKDTVTERDVKKSNGHFTKEDIGKVKKEHWHMIIRYARKKRIKAVEKEIKEYCNIAPPTKAINIKALLLYFTHEDEKSKKQNKYIYEEPVQKFNGFKVPIDKQEEKQEQLPRLQAYIHENRTQNLTMLISTVEEQQDTEMKAVVFRHLQDAERFCRAEYLEWKRQDEKFRATLTRQVVITDTNKKEEQKKKPVQKTTHFEQTEFNLSYLN